MFGLPTWVFSPKLWGALAVVALIGVVYYAGGIGPRDELALVQTQWDDERRENKKLMGVQIAHDAKNKERTDAENASRTADLNRELERLRNQPIEPVAPAPPDSKCAPGQICFDAAEFDGARGRLYSRLREVAGSCKKVAIDLDSAKAWANGD